MATNLVILTSGQFNAIARVVAQTPDASLIRIDEDNQGGTTSAVVITTSNQRIDVDLRF